MRTQRLEPGVMPADVAVVLEGLLASMGLAHDAEADAEAMGTTFSIYSYWQGASQSVLISQRVDGPAELMVAHRDCLAGETIQWVLKDPDDARKLCARLLSRVRECETAFVELVGLDD